MAMLTEQLRREKDRPTRDQTPGTSAFEAIGLVASAMGSKMKPYIEQILSCVKEGLQSRGKKNAQPEAPIFFCIGHLATAVGPHLTKYMHELLDLMFACGLSTSLVQALEKLVKAVPPLLRIVQERLLDMLSQTLINQPYRPLGAPIPQRLKSSLSRANQVQAQSLVESKSVETITVALTTLGEFDFTGHILNEFVRNCTLPYLENESVEVRKAAAITCANLFVQDPICYSVSMHAIEVVNDVLDKLMTVGIADPSESTKKKIVPTLSLSTDSFLHLSPQTPIFVGQC